MSAAACGGAGKQAAPPFEAKLAARDPVALLAPLDRSRWTSEAAPSAELVERLPDGTERAVLGRLRVETTPEGALRRARDLLPAGRPSALALPDRLGNGWAFSSTQGASLLWRTTSFLGRLEPLARVSLGPNVAVIAGPDRLLVRGLSTDRVEGIDAETGAVIGPGALPTAPRFSALAFADARHGVAFADLRGPLFTSDGGASWRALAVPDAQRGVTLEHERLVVQSSTGRMLVGPDGSVTAAEDPDAVTIARKSGPPTLGARPLRAAIETGWPMLDGTALVARAGVLARVRLDDGEIIAKAPLDGEEDATCITIRMGVDVGLACGGEGRGTTLRAFVPPLSTRVIARFATPRAVSPSGNGAVVVRGSCRDDQQDEAGSRAYCVIGRDGDRREIATRGDVGVERVVALGDGRVAVLVPPRGATDGVVTIIPPRGAATSVTMQLPPDLPALRRGLWLEGPIEIAPGEIAAWVDGGGTMGGVRVHLDDGTVIAGHTHAPLAMSGPVALAHVRGDRREALVETLDGGLTWQPVDVPALDQGKLVPGGTGRDAGVHCSAAGCSLPFERGTWLRVGWGPTADPTDLEDAREPTAMRLPTLPGAPSLACEVTKIETITEPGDARPDPRAMAIAMGSAAARRVDESIAWTPFHGASAPALPKGWVGFSELASNPSQATRLYAWAPKGATGATAARLQGRLFDRFDPEAKVRSSAVSVAPWRDEQSIADALGAGGPAVVFHGLLDPHGRAAVVAGCRGAGREACDLYGVVEGRAVLPLPESEDEPYLRLFAGGSAVGMDETFYVGGGGTPGVLVVWKIEPGRARVLARLPRLGSSVGNARLVRRTRSRGLGVLTTGPVGTRGTSQWFVMPIDPDTGALSDMITVGGQDTGGRPRRCTEDDDGWIVEGVSVGASVPGTRTGAAESRMRLDAGRSCIESMSATLLDISEARRPLGKTPPAKAPPKPPPAPAPAKPDADAIPLVALGAGKRVFAACRP
jgi:hypothetical protein